MKEENQVNKSFENSQVVNCEIVKASDLKYCKRHDKYFNYLKYPRCFWCTIELKAKAKREKNSLFQLNSGKITRSSRLLSSI